MQQTAVDYRKFSSQRRFGIELEFGNTISKTKVKSVIKAISPVPVTVTRYQPSVNNNFWHVKSDATCGPLGRLGPKGVEVASFIGRGIADLQHIADVAVELSQSGCKVNDNCGLHIHADAADLSVKQVGNLLAYWFKIERCLQFSLPERRRDNEYCKLLGSKIQVPKYLPVLSSPENFYCLASPTNLGYFENQDRRVNLNLVNYARATLYGSDARKTIELRWPEGTLESADVKCWTRLFLHFIETCKNRAFPVNLAPASLPEMLVYLGLGQEGSTFSILSEGLLDTKTWLLERFVKYSQNQYAQEATNILDFIWSPARKYA